MPCVDFYPASHMERPCLHPQAEPAPAMLSEVFAETPMDGAVTGFVLAQLGPGGKPVLWVQDRMSRLEAGRPCLAGMRPGVAVLKVDAPSARDSLWTAEQGLGWASLGGVIAEIWGDPPAVDFTATKRLALRSEAHGVPCWLLRRFTQPNLSAARERWRVGPLPSDRHAFDLRAPGLPRWRVELFRSRLRPPGVWTASYDPAHQHLVLDSDRANEETGAATDFARAV